MNRYIVIDLEENCVYSTNDLEYMVREDLFDRYGSSTSCSNKQELIEQVNSFLEDIEDNTLKDCKDFEILKEHFTEKEINTMQREISNYLSYLENNDDGISDVVENYIIENGNRYLIDWYEGLISTEEFINEVKGGK